VSTACSCDVVGALTMARNENLIKQLSQLEKGSRRDSECEQAPAPVAASAPAYRQKIANVKKTNNLIASHMKSDLKSLDGLEEGLEAMRTFLNRTTFEPSSSLSSSREREAEQVISLQDCLSLKHQTQDKIKKNILEQRREINTATRDKISQQSKPAILEEDLSDLQCDRRDDVGLTFLTDVAIVDQPPDTPKQLHAVQKSAHSVPLERSQQPAPAAAVEPRPQSRARNIHSVESLLKFFPTKEDEHIRRKSAGSLLMQRPTVRPSSGSAVGAGDGTNLIERQTEWMERIESKRRMAKLAQDKELVREVCRLLD
jgi:hypothetical protein